MLFGLYKKSLIFIVIPNNYMMYNGQHKLFLNSETIKSQHVRSLENKKVLVEIIGAYDGIT